MALETGTYISDLVATNPVSGDAKSQGDDHLRLLKSTIKATFPNVSNAVTPTHTELNYVDGVTSAIQTQLDAKAPLASPVLTGTPEAPTAATGSNNTQIATTAFVVATSLTASLPGQTGKDFYLLSTDGVTADWYNTIDTSVVTPVAGTAFVTTTATQTLTDKTITDPIIANDADTTKKANFDLSGITAGQNRTLTVDDRDTLIMTPGWVFLSEVTASASATADIETTIDGTYDSYVIVFNGVRATTDSVSLYLRTKIAGAYHSGASDYEYTLSMITDVYTQDQDFAGVAYIPIAVAVGNDTDRGLDGLVYLNNPASTSFYKRIRWEVDYLSAANMLTRRDGVGIDQSSTGAITGVRFLMSSGTIAAGKFKLFGIRGA